MGISPMTDRPASLKLHAITTQFLLAKTTPRAQCRFKTSLKVPAIDETVDFRVGSNFYAVDTFLFLGSVCSN